MGLEVLISLIDYKADELIIDWPTKVHRYYTILLAIGENTSWRDVVKEIKSHKEWLEKKHPRLEKIFDEADIDGYSSSEISQWLGLFTLNKVTIDNNEGDWYFFVIKNNNAI